MKTSSSSQLNETDLAYLEVLSRQLANEEITLKGFNIKKEAILARYHHQQKQEGKILKNFVRDSSIQWGLKSDHLKSGLFEGWISNGMVFKWSGLSYDHRYSKSEHFSGDLKCFFNKMAPIRPDFKWLGFWISDPIQNPDNLSPNLFLIIHGQKKNKTAHRGYVCR